MPERIISTVAPPPSPRKGPKIYVRFYLLRLDFGADTINEL